MYILIHFKRKFNNLEICISHNLPFQWLAKPLGEGVDKVIKEICCFAIFPKSKENAHYIKWNLVIKYAKYKYPYFYFLIRDCSASSILIIQVVIQSEIHIKNILCYVIHFMLTI